LLSLAGNHAFDLSVTGIQNTIREADKRKIVHVGTGKNLAEAAAPAYLHNAKGTVALVASASGLIAAGGSATADRPGVNELRVDAGDRENEATTDLPGAPGNTANREDSQRILESIREARQHADIVIVYQHNHVFGNHSFATIFTEGMPDAADAERLAEEVDACGGGCGCRHHGDAWRATAARSGNLSWQAHLLRSGQLYLQPAALAYLYPRTD
jgi:poly-gamma-glutamate capsule biosynthesis protein CapA/YwtB (metallophosphatase superfamily)